MMATGQQIATLLDGMARQLQAGTLDGSYYASMPGLCSTGPQQLSSSERQAVTSSLLRLAHALVTFEWDVADLASGYRQAIPAGACQAIAACCKLGAALSLDAAQAAQVCATVSVVLGFGRRALRRLTGQRTATEAALTSSRRKPGLCTI
jgi:hypothetical protein